MADTKSCGCGRDHDAELSKPKGEYLAGWSDERCQKMWNTLTKKAKVHKLSACMRNASGAKNAAGLCKALSIRVGYHPKKKGGASEVEGFVPVVPLKSQRQLPADYSDVPEWLRPEKFRKKTRLRPLEDEKPKDEKPKDEGSPKPEEKKRSWLQKLLGKEGSVSQKKAYNPAVVTGPAAQQYSQHLLNQPAQQTQKKTNLKGKDARETKLLNTPDQSLSVNDLREKKKLLEEQKSQKKQPSKFKLFLLKQLGWPEEEIKKMQTASTRRVRIASIQIRSARTLRRVAQSGRFIYKGWVYERTADGPAENVTKAKTPPTDAIPEWIEDGYDKRKNEKGPKPLWPEEKEVPSKSVTDAKEPMEVKTGAKGSKGPDYSIADMDDEDGLRNIPDGGPFWIHHWDAKNVVIFFKAKPSAADLKAAKKRIFSDKDED